MAALRGDRRAAEIVHDLFGATLQQQGRGFYVALELLAIVKGVADAQVDGVLSPVPQKIRYARSSHDFARRIATGTEMEQDVLARAIQGTTTLDTLHALLSSLIVDVPGRRRAPKWFAAHLYPFVGELVHYDAVERKRRPAIERYVFRDGGGLAYKILRTDADESRRIRNRDGLLALVDESGTALGRIASALRAHDEAPQPSGPFEDDSEAEASPHAEVSPWPDALRSGVDRIVGRTSTPRAKRIEQLLHWVPYCVARHQLALALTYLELPREVIPVDATTEPNPLRVRSQITLEKFRWDIVSALTRLACERQEQAPLDQQDLWSRYTQPNASFTSSPRAFFSETLAAVGALNATTGRRHFTFKPPMLEALLAATIDPGREIEFQDFCTHLSERFSLVIDEYSAQRADMTVDIDAGVFAVNSRAFKSQLAATGLLTHYSDATSLVHGEAR